MSNKLEIVKNMFTPRANLTSVLFLGGLVGIAISTIGLLLEKEAFGQTYTIDEIVAEVAHDLNCFPSTLCNVTYNGTHIIVTHLPDFVGDITQIQVFKPEQTSELFGPQRQTSNSIEGDASYDTETSYIETVAEVNNNDNEDNDPQIAYCNEQKEICVNIEDGKITNPVDSYYTMMYEKFGNFEDMATDFVDPFDTLEGDYVSELERDYNKLSDHERMILGDAASFVKERNNIPADNPNDNEDEPDEHEYFFDYPEVGIKANAQLADNQNAIASKNNDNEIKNIASNDNEDNDSKDDNDNNDNLAECDGYTGNGMCHDSSDEGPQEGTTTSDEDNEDNDVTNIEDSETEPETQTDNNDAENSESEDQDNEQNDEVEQSDNDSEESEDTNEVEEQ